MKTHSRWKIAGASALLMLCSCGAFGQAPDGPPPGPPPDDAAAAQGPRMQGSERELGHLTKMLNLTADQQKGVRSVLEQRATEMRALRGKAQADASSGQAPDTREARMTQMKQIWEESNTKISALLDENQRKTFADYTQKREAMMQRRMDHRGGDEPPPPPPDGGAGGPPPPPNE